MSRYKREITQCNMDNKMLKLKISQMEEIVLEMMIKVNIIETQMNDNKKMLDKVYHLLSNEISELNESVNNISNSGSPIVSSNSDN